MKKENKNITETLINENLTKNSKNEVFENFENKSENLKKENLEKKAEKINKKEFVKQDFINSYRR